MQPLDIGSRRELFADGALIDRMTDVRLDLKHPERREAFTLDAPWEDAGAFPYSVLAEGDRVRYYYRASTQHGDDEERAILAGVLESRDGGCTFTRPALHLHAFAGSTANNLVAVGRPGCPPVFRDTNPACREAERYKGLQCLEGQAYAMASADGLTWRLLQESPLDYSGAFDTVNTAFWDAVTGCYRSYTRVWVNKATAEGTMRIRCIQSAMSPDFIHWSQPVENVYADGREDVHLYTNATLPCPGAEHLYLAFPNRFMERRWVRRGQAAMPATPGCNDGLFMISRDGVHWTRYLDAWVRPGPDPLNWTHRNNYPTWGIVPVSATEWSMFANEHFGQPGTPGRIRRLAVRPHGFVSVRGDARGGEFTTHPLIFTGRCLRLNYATAAGGQLQVEIQDAAGHPLAGFRLADMAPLFGDEVDGGVTWQAGSDVSALSGKPVRLRFVLHDADLYAFRVSADAHDVTSGAVAPLLPATYRTRATRTEVRVRPVAGPPALDGDSRGWDWSEAVTIQAPDQYTDYCHARVTLLYDQEALYVAAAVADPYPMVNTLGFDGDMRRSWSSDALQLHLQAVTGAPPAAKGAIINDIRLWYSTPEGRAGCCIIPGLDTQRARVNPTGVQGAFRRREDGKGYTLTFRLPWSALHSHRAPLPGERLTACIQCHWGTANGDGLLCGGVEVRADNAPEVYVPESWGQAVFA
jgi:hypothetical protein